MLRIVFVFWLVTGAVVLFVDSPFLLMLCGYAFAFSLFALSINILLGGLGEVPLGQSLFFGLGAYAAALLMLRAGWPFPLAALGAMVLAAVVSWIVGVLTLKLTGANFSIVSWGIAGVAGVAALNFDGLTGGPLGLFGFPPMKVGLFDLADPHVYLVCTALAAGVAMLVLEAVRRAPFGQAMTSVRESRHLAQAVGIDASGLRLQAFVFSAPFAALSGVLTLPYTNIVNPDIMSVVNTVDGLLMALLGGTASIFGPVGAALVFIIVPHLLHLDPNVRVIVFSAMVIGVLFFAPGGLKQIATRIAGRFMPGRAGRAP
ncbi:branched-chain amino acid ABC transporter permease [Variovorax sp.]|jgi:branched-chain amino acid transport system permease protein|uniref:branched-chain amino acid ABC transporter permease n=1 Tax=Variovorax sp. TaxID=1871043 RepID=UPI000C51FB99|nr:branched-chain amino acid ABC transporter permease [Variovorax sp.]MBS80744.1 branched-chain amino acid ABC transporter permease [Variovorax sp.]